MRIITGTARGTKLVTPDGEDTRPTAERVKEAIFSAIQFDLQDKAVLELFAGSGQLSFEALSRGAGSAVIVDFARSSVESIRTNALKTKLADKCRVVSADWKEFLKSAKDQGVFELVFLDPPYKRGFPDEVLKRLYASGVLAEEHIIIVESDEEGIPTPRDDKEQKLYRYGKTYVSIIRSRKE